MSGDAAVTDPCEDDLANLKAECSKRKRNRSMVTIVRLTTSTYSARRQWIQQTQPPVPEVIEKYPSLTIHKIVSVVTTFSHFNAHYTVSK